MSLFLVQEYDLKNAISSSVFWVPREMSYEWKMVLSLWLLEKIQLHLSSSTNQRILGKILAILVSIIHVLVMKMNLVISLFQKVGISLWEIIDNSLSMLVNVSIVIDVLRPLPQLNLFQFLLFPDELRFLSGTLTFSSRYYPTLLLVH